jgi:hypothetical protein
MNIDMNDPKIKSLWEALKEVGRLVFSFAVGVFLDALVVFFTKNPADTQLMIFIGLVVRFIDKWWWENNKAEKPKDQATSLIPF